MAKNCCWCIVVLCFVGTFAQNRPQTPEPPYPYELEDVFYKNEEAGAMLAGTLSYPKNGVYSDACVVLTPGANGHTRDENTAGHRTFKVLGDHLTRQNISVLRYDERGIGESTGSFRKATCYDFSDDVIAGIKYMRGRKEFQRCKMGVIGHSKGGLVAMLTAKRSTLVEFIVILGSPTFDLTESLLLQTILILKSVNTSDDEIDKQVRYTDEIFTIIKSTKDLDEMKSKLVDCLKNFMNGTFKEGDEERVLFYSDAWYKSILLLNMDELTASLKMPVLAAWGTLDMQTPVRENLPFLKGSLMRANNHNYTLMALPKINHLMQTAVNGSSAEYPLISETFAPWVLRTVSKWINSHFPLRLN